MMIRLSELRLLVHEALVDRLRVPRGPNSRDDADDVSVQADDGTEDNDTSRIAKG